MFIQTKFPIEGEITEEVLDDTYYIEDIESLECSCGCGKLDSGFLVEHQPFCHPNAGSLIWYGKGLLFVSCRECNRTVARFAIAERKENG